MTLLSSRLFGVVLVSLVAAAWPAAARSASSSAFLIGIVTDRGVPVANAGVAATGNNSTTRTTTDAKGRFAFASLGLGTYTVTASSASLHAEARLDLGLSGASLDLPLADLKTIGNVTVVRDPPVRGSGADVTLNSTFLTRSPTSDSFPETLIQLPGAARGAI